jgi:elongation factor 2
LLATAQKYRFDNLDKGRIEDRYAKAFRECDPGGPLILYVFKMISSLEQAGRFFAFSLVFAGKVSTNMEVRIMGPNFAFGSENDHDLYEKIVHSTRIWMSDSFVPVQNVPCGNIVAMAGLDEVITKSATLTNMDKLKAHPIRAMKFSVSPVVHYGFNVKIKTIFQSLKKVCNC